MALITQDSYIVGYNGTSGAHHFKNYQNSNPTSYNGYMLTSGVSQTVAETAILPQTQQANMWYGASISMENGRVIVGAPEFDSGGNRVGYAEILDHEGTHVATLSSPSTSYHAPFGAAVGIGCDRIAVAPVQTSSGTYQIAIFDLVGNFLFYCELPSAFPNVLDDTNHIEIKDDRIVAFIRGAGIATWDLEGNFLKGVTDTSVIGGGVGSGTIAAGGDLYDICLVDLGWNTPQNDIYGAAVVNDKVFAEDVKDLYSSTYGASYEEDYAANWPAGNGGTYYWMSGGPYIKYGGQTIAAAEGFQYHVRGIQWDYNGYAFGRIMVCDGEGDNLIKHPTLNAPWYLEPKFKNSTGTALNSESAIGSALAMSNGDIAAGSWMLDDSPNNYTEYPVDCGFVSIWHFGSTGKLGQASMFECIS